MGIVSTLVVLGLATTSAGASGPVTVKWYTAPQPGGSFAAAAAACTKAANGKYRIDLVPLPSDASVQREQLVRRLAAEDSDIDLISMDVIWTAEFGGAKWIVPWPRAIAAKAAQGVIPAVLQTGRYKNRMYAGPLNTGSQLLWYRKDLVPNPPTTWDEMIKMADALPAGKNFIEVQGARYEGLSVWFNSLLESAGGRILTKSGAVSLARAPTQKALQVMRDVAHSKAADPSLSNSQEPDGELTFQNGKAAFMVNYPFVYVAIQKGNKDVFKNLGVALFPRVDPDRPARVTLGGYNLGVSRFSNHRQADFEAAQCLEQPENQIRYAVGDGLPPISESLYQDPKVVKTFPYANLLLQTFQAGSTRPVSPAYNDISLAIQGTIHPPASISPSSGVSSLRSRVDDAVNSRGLL
jgi:multiple sugar transport system substrate-binding protein